jgi:Mobilization protein NikA
MSEAPQYVAFRITPAEYTILQKAADKSGLTVAQYTRACTGLGQGIRDAASEPCSNPYHMKCVELASSIVAAVTKYDQAMKAQKTAAPKPAADPRNAMKGEGRKNDLPSPSGSPTAGSATDGLSGLLGSHAPGSEPAGGLDDLLGKVRGKRK